MSELETLVQKPKQLTVRISFALIAAMFVLVQSSVALAFSGGGLGTEGDPFIITDCTELQEMEDDLDAHYRLGNDIDCSETADWNSGSGFDPVGDDSTPFIGSLDGDGYSIDRLMIIRANDVADDSALEDESYVGLFGYTNGADINDVHIRNSKIKGHQYVGGIVGWLNAGTITNSTVNLTTATSDCDPGECVWARYGQYGGGIVGYMENGTISNAHSAGPVKGSGNIIGGLIGQMNGGTLEDSSSSSDVDGGTKIGGAVGYLSGGTIERVYATGNARAEFSEYAGKGGRDVGGFVGSMSSGSITDVYATGDVTTDTDRAGGFVGIATDGQITRAYATGSVTGDSGAYTGPFVGRIYAQFSGEPTFTDSFAVGENTDPTNNGAFAGRSDRVVSNTPLANVWYDETTTGKTACYEREANGGDEDQFEEPEDVVVDSVGNVYVADQFGHRIQKFDSDGTFITKWGSNGSGDGQFNFPAGIAVDAADNVYVADVANNRIQKFDSDGTFITKWGSNGSGDGQFSSSVRRIAIDASDNVYVADASNRRIQKFDSDGTFITKWGSNGSGDGQFFNPSGVAFDSNGDVYVTDQGNARIQKFDSDGTFITKWGSSGSGNGQFSSVRDIAIDASNNVYVSDNANNRIQKLSTAGTYIAQWGAYGSEDGNFYTVEGIATDSAGTVYVTDSGRYSIEKFNASGVFQSRIIGDTVGYEGCTGVYASNDQPDYFFDSTNEPFAGSWSTDTWFFNGTSLPVLANVDGDQDGISTAQEQAAPNNGDANNNGVADYLQVNVSSMINPITGEYVSLAMNEECEITSLAIVAESEVDDAGDGDFSYPAGFMDFAADCGTPGFTADITQYYYGLNEAVELRKYTPASGYSKIYDAVISSQTIDDNQVMVVSYQVTDGGELDIDGLLNGIIEDPVGLAVTTDTAVPDDDGASLADTGADQLILYAMAVVGIAAGLRIARTKHSYFTVKK